MKRLLGEERGVALVLTLLVVALMTTLIVEFDFRTRLDLRSAYNFRDNAQATVLADTGTKVVSYVLSLDKNRYDGQPINLNDEYWWSMSGFNGTDFQGLSFSDDLLPGANILLRVTDESGKLNLNDLSFDTSTDPPQQVATRIEIFRRLLEILDVADLPDVQPEVLIACLLEWLDTSLASPGLSNYCKPDGEGGELAGVTRGSLRALDELRLIGGYTPEVVARLQPHVTALPPEAATNSGASAAGGAVLLHKININTASVELLTALHEGMTDNMAASIDLVRKQKSFQLVNRKAIEDVPSLNIGTVPAELAKLLRVDNDYFAAGVTGYVGDTQRTVRALLSRKDKTQVMKDHHLEVVWWRVE